MASPRLSVQQESAPRNQSVDALRGAIMTDFGYPLWAVYVVWIVVLIILYPACLWFARLRQRRHDWWLRYL
jgi:hypothetical protein